MHAVALIVEYNPFHNGHLHHLSEAKKMFPESTIIVILNGNFLQRGEPALIDKFTRTRWSLQAGADIVVELPFAFGTQRADIFAKGNIAIANMLGASHVVYGIEDTITTDNVDLLLPNQRLAFFYEKEIAAHAHLTGVPIERIHSGYNDTVTTHESIASATAIRQILAIEEDEIEQFVPDFVATSLLDTTIPHAKLSDYFPVLQTKLLKSDKTIPAMMQHGMFENVITALEHTNNFADFFDTVHHKHMSKTHTARALTYMLTNTSQEQLDEAITSIWTRILGLSKQGQKYLRYVKKSTDEPLAIIDKIAELQTPHDVLQYNSMIAYALITKQSIGEAIEAEYQSKPIFL